MTRDPLLLKLERRLYEGTPAQSAAFRTFAAVCLDVIQESRPHRGSTQIGWMREEAERLLAFVRDAIGLPLTQEDAERHHRLLTAFVEFRALHYAELCAALAEHGHRERELAAERAQAPLPEDV